MPSAVLVFIGNCGISIGAKLHQAFLNYEQPLKSFLDKDGDYAFVFLDSDEEAIRANVHKQFPIKYVVTGNENSSGSYGKGLCTTSSAIIDKSTKMVEKLLEMHTIVIIFHSLGGGTGSSLCPMLISRIKSKKMSNPIITISILPSYNHYSFSIMEPYNVGSCLYEIMETLCTIIIMDNEEIYNFCTNVLQINDTSLSNMNEVIINNLFDLFNCIDDPLSRNKLIHYLENPAEKLVMCKMMPLTPKNKQTTVTHTEILKMFSQYVASDTKISLKTKEEIKLAISAATPGAIKSLQYEFDGVFIILNGDNHSKCANEYLATPSLTGTGILKCQEAYDCLYPHIDGYLKMFEKRAFVHWLSADLRDEQFVYVEKYLKQLMMDKISKHGTKDNKVTN